MRIEIEESADQNVMHFYPEGGLGIKSSAEYCDAKSLRKSPLAESIFDLGGVVAILITPECVSVTKQNEESWSRLKPQILAEIMDFLASGAQVVIGGEADSDEEIIAKIKALLEARMRPAVQKDGGDIVFRGYDNGIVYVEMQGKCVGCPYAQRTLKDGIEKTLRTYIPEIKAVEKYEN